MEQMNFGYVPPFWVSGVCRDAGGVSVRAVPRAFLRRKRRAIFMNVRKLLLFTTLGATALLVVGCEATSKKSALEARAHVKELARLAKEDVREIRDGLPKGGAEVEKLLSGRTLDVETARDLLTKGRDHVQDLRTAKSTFFALAGADGVVIRNDQEQDRMAQKPLFSAFPALKGALEAPYLETRGNLPEAAEVRGRPDAEWIAAVPVRVDGAPRALFVTGWSWSAYAYRMQTSLRSFAAPPDRDQGKMPLLYAFVVVDREAYGARDAPDVNIKAVLQENVLEKAKGSEPFSVELEITGRPFGLAAIVVPELGDKVALAVLRSET
jgi:hypothetical protein